MFPCVPTCLAIHHLWVSWGRREIKTSFPLEIFSSLLTSVALMLPAVLSSDFSFQAPEPRRVCHVLSVEQSKEIQPSLSACVLLEIDSWCLVMFQENHRLGIGLLNQETTCDAFFFMGQNPFTYIAVVLGEAVFCKVLQIDGAKKKNCNQVDYFHSGEKVSCRFYLTWGQECSFALFKHLPVW